MKIVLRDPVCCSDGDDEDDVVDHYQYYCIGAECFKENESQ